MSLLVVQVFGAALGAVGCSAKPLRRRAAAAAAALFALALRFPLPPYPQTPTPNDAYTNKFKMIIREAKERCVLCDPQHGAIKKAKCFHPLHSDRNRRLGVLRLSRRLLGLPTPRINNKKSSCYRLGFGRSREVIEATEHAC